VGLFLYIIEQKFCKRKQKRERMAGSLKEINRITGGAGYGGQILAGVKETDAELAGLIL
jgi:hypothetical protein